VCDIQTTVYALNNAETGGFVLTAIKLRKIVWVVEGNGNPMVETMGSETPTSHPHSTVRGFTASMWYIGTLAITARYLEGLHESFATNEHQWLGTFSRVFSSGSWVLGTEKFVIRGG
jgi:hypothetical protein